MKNMFLLSLLSILSILSCVAPESSSLVEQELKISDTDVTISVGSTQKIQITEGNSPYKIKADNDKVSCKIKGKSIFIKALETGDSALTLIDSENKKILINVLVDKNIDVFQSLKVIDQNTDVEISDDITLEKNNVKRIKLLGSGDYSFEYDKGLISVQKTSEKQGSYKITAIKKGDAKIHVTDNVTGKVKNLKVKVEHFFIVKNGKLILINEGAIKNGVLVIPPNVTEISGSPKKDSDILTKDQKKKLKEIVLGDHTENTQVSVLRYAFKRCYNVEKITFGPKVNKIDICIFIIDDEDYYRSLLKLKEVIIKKKNNKDLRWAEGTSWKYTFCNYKYRGKATCRVPADSDYFEINQAWDYFFKEILLIEN